jgi:hypothetical protein
MALADKIPNVGIRSTPDKQFETFLKANPALHLGGDVDFH